jgi:amino acid transporter
MLELTAVRSSLAPTTPAPLQYFCGLASVTANSRTLFAFSRDGAVPGFKLWSWVSPRNQTPIAATWAMVLAAFILGLPMLGSVVAFTAVTSIATIGLYISYAIPILLRVTAARKSFEPGPWNLGRFGVPIGIVAVLWVGFLTVLFVLPTAYPVTALNFNYASVAVGFVLVFCLGYWLLSARRWYDGPHTHCRLPDAQATQVVAKA